MSIFVGNRYLIQQCRSVSSKVACLENTMLDGQKKSVNIGSSLMKEQVYPKQSEIRFTL